MSRCARLVRGGVSLGSVKVVLVFVALVVPAHAERTVSVAADTSIALGGVGRAEQIMPDVLAAAGMRVALEAEPTPTTLRTCWMQGAPSAGERSLRDRCSTSRVAVVPQAGVSRVWLLGNGEGTMALAGARAELAIRYLVPRAETLRVSIGARGGLMRDREGNHAAWDASIGMATGDRWTFGWEFGVTSWRYEVEMRPTSAWFARLGLLVGAWI